MITYVVIGGILMVGDIIFMFLKKSQTNLEDRTKDNI